MRIQKSPYSQLRKKARTKFKIFLQVKETLPGLSELGRRKNISHKN
jgi:hypothetical protein